MLLYVWSLILLCVLLSMLITNVVQCVCSSMYYPMCSIVIIAQCVQGACCSMCCLIGVACYARYPICCALTIILYVAKCARYAICCTMCLVFYILLVKFDILWVTQWTWVSLKLGKLGAVMLLDQVNRYLTS